MGIFDFKSKFPEEDDLNAVSPEQHNAVAVREGAAAVESSFEVWTPATETREIVPSNGSGETWSAHAAPHSLAEEETPMQEDTNPAGPRQFTGVDTGVSSAESQPAMQNGTSSPDAQAAGPVGLAQQLTSAVEELVRQLEEQENTRKELERRLAEVEANAQSAQAFNRRMRELTLSTISPEDLQNLQRVLQTLSQDPNHIMVLAAVAQQAPLLLQVIGNYTQVRNALS